MTYPPGPRKMGEAEAMPHEAMKDIYDTAKRQLHYNATYFIQMVAEHGGLETARRLLSATTPSQGFAELWERKRLDLSVEALVLDERFSHLFNPQELAVARQRLINHGFNPTNPTRPGM